MNPFYLSEITTGDGLVHQGIFFRPAKPGKKAILWIHGLTGRFYGDPLINDAFADECERFGWGFAAFNNRGHDVVANMRKTDGRKKTGFAHKMIGAGLEVFADCVYDIDAAIGFLASEGFSEVVLVGHSTGANKACYYAGMRRDPRMIAVVLAGPMSDRFSKNTDRKLYDENLALMKKLVAEGKGDEILLRHFFPMTAKRWLSLLSPGSKEDVFNYWDKKNVLTVFQKIRKPLLMVFAQNDETANKPVDKIKQVFDHYQRSTNYASIIIPETTHSYVGKEKEAVAAISSWVSSI